jgi:hypothetical protein
MYSARARTTIRRMPRYLIERTYTVDMDKLPEVATRSKAIGHHRYPEIVWEHSHVVVDADGTPKSYCVYQAPNEEVIRAHSQQLGDHVIEAIYEIAGDVSPADFPLTEAPAVQA